jgi:glycerol-3-phosphate dehydrogenase
MKRNPQQIEQSRYDLIVIGAGINGIATAYEAATRGLKTCLLEAADFMSQTSSNSLKIIHGGFRYLQQADVRRIRESNRERRILLKIAPHLVHPLRCVMPTEKPWKLRGRPALAAGLAANALISFDRSQGLPRDKQIPAGSILSKKQLIKLLGKEFDRPAVTGAAVWHDGMAVNTERLGLAFLHSGVAHGLAALNYCPVLGFCLEKNRITGVRVRDAVQGREFSIAADFVVNAAGAWTGSLLNLLPNVRHRDFPLIRLMNLVIQRELFPTLQAVGLFDHDRAFFFVPWRGCWMIGTDEATWRGKPESLQVSEEEIEGFLAKINRVYSGRPISRQEVCHVHKGFAPGREKPDGTFRMLDHAEDGIDNFVSILPVKYTTARDIGQKTVDCYFKKTGRPFVPSETSKMPLAGGEMPSFAEFFSQKSGEIMAETGISQQAACRLLQHYGTSYEKILRYADLLELVPGSDEVLKAEIAYAVDEEMAQTLTDVVLRRTDLGSAGEPKPESLACCAAMIEARLDRQQEKTESPPSGIQEAVGSI